MDDYPHHLQDVILRELFPHLATIHQALITEPDSVFPPHFLIKEQLDEADEIIQAVMNWADASPRDPHYPFNQGYNQAVQEVNHILSTGTLPDEDDE